MSRNGESKIHEFDDGVEYELFFEIQSPEPDVGIYGGAFLAGGELCSDDAAFKSSLTREELVAKYGEEAIGRIEIDFYEGLQDSYYDL